MTTPSVSWKSLRRTCWAPVVQEGAHTRQESRFGGEPWLGAGESWPTCGRCREPLAFFVQLDLATLPEPMRRPCPEGLVQMFYCPRECEAFGGFEPFSPMHRLRLVPVPGQSGPCESAPKLFPARRIVGWTPLEDLPNGEESREYGVDLTEQEHREPFPHSGDKLGGWPYWVQGVEYPNCPTCQTRMELLLQLDSEDNIPFMFGDVGCGHITRCPRHPEVLAFAWACG